MAKKKSMGAAPKGPSTTAPEDLGGKEAQGHQMDATGLTELDDPDALDDPDVANHVDDGAVVEGENNDEPKLVSIVHERTIVNGHVMKSGTVIKMTPVDIDRHREAGVPLLPVSEDYDGEVYDCSEPYVAKESA